MKYALKIAISTLLVSVLYVQAVSAAVTDTYVRSNDYTVITITDQNGDASALYEALPLRIFGSSDEACFEFSCYMNPGQDNKGLRFRENWLRCSRSRLGTDCTFGYNIGRGGLALTRFKGDKAIPVREAVYSITGSNIWRASDRSLTIRCTNQACTVRPRKVDSFVYYGDDMNVEGSSYEFGLTIIGEQADKLFSLLQVTATRPNNYYGDLNKSFQDRRISVECYSSPSGRQQGLCWVFRNLGHKLYGNPIQFINSFESKKLANSLSETFEISDSKSGNASISCNSGTNICKIDYWR